MAGKVSVVKVVSGHIKSYKVIFIYSNQMKGIASPYANAIRYLEAKIMILYTNSGM